MLFVEKFPALLQASSPRASALFWAATRKPQPPSVTKRGCQAGIVRQSGEGPGDCSSFNEKLRCPPGKELRVSQLSAGLQ